jgi:hypothetical protein
MILINNKEESTNFIKKHNLNQFDEQIFFPSEKEKIKEYLNKHKEELYIIRTKEPKVRQKVYFNLTKEEVLSHVNEYKIFSIDVSSINYKENKILTGDIKITIDMQVYLTATTNKEATNRTLHLEPSYNLIFEVNNKKIRNIPGVDFIINYIFKNNLFDIILEFCVYDIPLGKNKENVIIYEARTY